MKVGIIIPAFNEEANIARLVAQILAEPWAPDLTLAAILIIDDCSTDKTKAIAQHLARQYPVVRVLAQAKRGGKNAAIRAGANTLIDIDCLVVLDADLTLEPGTLTRTVAALDDSESCVVGASCIIEPLPIRSWQERASYAQALLVAELKRCGVAYLSAIYAVRASARDALTSLPDGVADDAYITLWLRAHNHRYVICRQAAAYIRAATGLRDFARQTLRGRRGETETHAVLHDDRLMTHRHRVIRHAMIRILLRDPLSFVLYAFWYAITLAVPQRVWTPAITLSTYEPVTSTKQVTPRAW